MAACRGGNQRLPCALGMIPALLITIGRLAALAGAGFLVFRHPWMQRHALRPFVVGVLYVLFPFYLVVRIPAGWESAQALSPGFMVFMFLLSPVTLLVAGAFGMGLSRTAGPRIRRPGDFVILSAIHNAGFIPLPILERLAPEPIILGMFLYVTAFNASFWAVIAPTIRAGSFSWKNLRLPLNPPILAIALGSTLAILGVQDWIPARTLQTAARIGQLGLDGALVALGASLAGIREPLSMDSDHRWFAVGRMLVFPALVLALMALPLPGLGGPLGWSIRLLVVMQAAMPPATQTLVLTRAVGQPESVHYTGSMTVFSYAVSLLTIPAFVSLSLLLFPPG